MGVSHWSGPGYTLPIKTTMTPVYDRSRGSVRLGLTVSRHALRQEGVPPYPDPCFREVSPLSLRTGGPSPRALSRVPVRHRLR